MEDDEVEMQKHDGGNAQAMFFDLAQELHRIFEAQLKIHHQDLICAFDSRISLLEERLLISFRTRSDSDGKLFSMEADNVESMCASEVPPESPRRKEQAVSFSMPADEMSDGAEDQRAMPVISVDALESPPLSESWSKRNSSDNDSGRRRSKETSFMKMMKASGSSLWQAQTASMDLSQVGWARYIRQKCKAWGGRFDMVIGFAVFVNLALIFAQLQSPQTPSAALDIAEMALSMVFLLEIAIRLFMSGRDFCTPLNVADMFIVLATCIDLFLLGDIGGAASNLRLIKILRVGKTLRVIRTMSQFRHLRVLLGTIASSIGSFFWSMLILAMCQVTGGLLLCQMVQDFITDEGKDPESRRWVDRMYGTSTRAIYSLFEVTFSGGWPTLARPLVEDVSPLYAIFFVAYITSVNFSITRIISALFLKETLHSAATDADMRIQEARAHEREMANRLRDLFSEADLDHNCTINMEEFQRLAQYPNVLAWFKSLGIDVADSKATFDLLTKTHGVDNINRDQFVNGLLKLQGSATSQDIARVGRLAHQLAEHLEALKRSHGELARSHGRLTQVLTEPVGVVQGQRSDRMSVSDIYLPMSARASFDDRADSQRLEGLTPAEEARRVAV